MLPRVRAEVLLGKSEGSTRVPRADELDQSLQLEAVDEVGLRIQEIGGVAVEDGDRRVNVAGLEMPSDVAAGREVLQVRGGGEGDAGLRFKGEGRVVVAFLERRTREEGGSGATRTGGMVGEVRIGSDHSSLDIP